MVTEEPEADVVEAIERMCKHLQVEHDNRDPIKSPWLTYQYAYKQIHNYHADRVVIADAKALLLRAKAEIERLRAPSHS